MNIPPQVSVHGLGQDARAVRGVHRGVVLDAVAADEPHQLLQLGPNRIFGNPSFGRIFSAKNPREMQFGLRLSF